MYIMYVCYQTKYMPQIYPSVKQETINKINTIKRRRESFSSVVDRLLELAVEVETNPVGLLAKEIMWKVATNPSASLTQLVYNGDEPRNVKDIIESITEKNIDDWDEKVKNS